MPGYDLLAGTLGPPGGANGERTATQLPQPIEENGNVFKEALMAIFSAFTVADPHSFTTFIAVPKGARNDRNN